MLFHSDAALLNCGLAFRTMESSTLDMHKEESPVYTRQLKHRFLGFGRFGNQKQPTRAREDTECI